VDLDGDTKTLHESASCLLQVETDLQWTTGNVSNEEI